MKIIGIDPGTERIGYAVVQSGDPVRLVSAETIHVPLTAQPAARLARLEKLIAARLGRDRPDIVAVEKLFFAKNAKTALGVAEARGIILLTASRFARSIWECTPLEVKSAVCGDGHADKKQIRKMIELIFPRHPLPREDDAIDAVAIALAAFYANNYSLKEKTKIQR